MNKVWLQKRNSLTLSLQSVQYSWLQIIPVNSVSHAGPQVWKAICSAAADFKERLRFPCRNNVVMSCSGVTVNHSRCSRVDEGRRFMRQTAASGSQLLRREGGSEMSKRQTGVDKYSVYLLSLFVLPSCFDLYFCFLPAVDVTERDSFLSWCFTHRQTAP